MVAKSDTSRQQAGNEGEAARRGGVGGSGGDQPSLRPAKGQPCRITKRTRWNSLPVRHLVWLCQILGLFSKRTRNKSFRRLRQEDPKFEASLVFMVNETVSNKKKKNSTDSWITN